MKRRFITIIAPALLLCLLTAYAKAVDTFGPWPEGKDPKTVGKKLVENLVARNPATRPHGYPEVCTGYGSFRFADTIKDKDLLDKLMARYGVITDPDSKVVRKNPGHVDASVWGTLPLKIYQVTKNEKFLPLGLHCADHQWENPLENGLTKQTRFWVDDMFMITGLQVNAYRATGDKKYLDRAAKEMVAYIEKLQQPNGLFHHRDPEAPIFWSRGNGWVAVGMTEILFDLPEDHPDRAKIVDGYKKMMAALKKYQTDSGAWRQILDYEPSWLESSGTGMFTFAIANGVKKGWLPADEYKPVIQKSWPALVSYMDPDGSMREVCIGTNTSKDIQYYMGRPRKTGDFHGQAAAIWATWAVLE